MSSSPPDSSSRSSIVVVFPQLWSKNRNNVCLVTISLVVVALLATIGVTNEKIVFRACFGSLLAIFVFIQLYVAMLLFLNRHNSLLELCQPVGLSVATLSGSIATAGAFMLALPEYNLSCALRQPIILTSISLMGSTLVARTWRIGCILSPAIAFASPITATTGHAQLNSREKIQMARSKAMNILTKVSEWTSILCSYSECKKRVRFGRNSVQQTITMAASARVTAVLTMPQIILQIANLSVPAIRMQSVEIDDGLYCCQCDIGPWLLVFGTIFASAPFFVALLLNVKSEGIPEIFTEFNQIETCMRISMCVLSITMPTVMMIANVVPNAHAYLMTSSLMSFVLPLCYHISWLRVSTITRENAKAKRDRFKKNAVSVIRSSMVRTGERTDDLETLQIAEDADMMSTMFDAIGNSKKAIEINDIILSLFTKDGEYKCDDGFTDAEIESFGPKTLKAVVITLIKSAKLRSSSAVASKGEGRQTALQQGIKNGHEALRVFEQAPAKKSLKDRSVIFPGYSVMAMLMTAGVPIVIPNIQGLASSNIEDVIAFNFVRENQFQLFHYCRALVMKAEALGRSQLFNDAFAVVDKIKEMYDPELHSGAIAKEYGTDHCATIISVTALWHIYLKNKEQALDICEDVIKRILPEIAKTNADNNNLVGMHHVLMPIIQSLRAQGPIGANRARELYNLHIVRPYKIGSDRVSPGRILIRPVTILLHCSSKASIQDDIEWILSGEANIMDQNDTYTTNLIFLSIYSLFAEVCLHLAKQLEVDDEKQRPLIDEGLRLSSLADPKMKDEGGNVTNPVAFESHSRIYSELQRFNESNV